MIHKKDEDLKFDTLETSSVASIYKRRFCKACFIWRPPLASHCRHCDQCVTHFDHHCFLVNTCIGRRNMRNFVIFTNSIFMMCLLYVISYLTVISDHLLIRDVNVYKANRDEILTYDIAVLLLMIATEIFVPKLRWLSTLLGIMYWYRQCSAMYDSVLCYDSIYTFYYLSSCFGVGTSLSYVSSYLTLTYQGFTKKELRSVEIETERKVRCVDPFRGLSNMFAFYVMNSSDREKGRSELQKQILIDK